MIYTLANMAYALGLMTIVMLNIIGIQESSGPAELIFRFIVIIIVIGVVLR